MSKNMDIYAELDNFVEENEGQVTLTDVAKHFAEHGYQYAIDKACEFIRLHIGVDMPVRLSPDGEPLAEDFINKAESRVNAANKVVEQFKQFMEG